MKNYFVALSQYLSRLWYFDIAIQQFYELDKWKAVGYTYLKLKFYLKVQINFLNQNSEFGVSPLILLTK